MSKEEAAMPPRVSGKWVSERANHVTINQQGIKELANQLEPVFRTKQYSLCNWRQHKLNPKSMDATAVNWVFFADTLNFSFWSDDQSQKYTVTYDGQQYTGYWSLCAAMNRAIDQGIDLLDVNFYSKMTREEFCKIFAADDGSQLPLVDERLSCLHEVGAVLLREFGGDFNNLLAAAGMSADRLVKMVVECFPCYRDEAEYQGKKVSLYKRAQILAADIWGAMEGSGAAAFTDIDSLTAFADYRIPQALEYFDVLRYSPELKQQLQLLKLLDNGCEMEVEIRAATIRSVELLAVELMGKLSSDSDVVVNEVLLDHYLWDYRREKARLIDELPFHRTRCIYY